jgi:hypothetical protein
VLRVTAGGLVSIEKCVYITDGGPALANVATPIGPMYETTVGQYKLHVVLNGAATGIELRGEGTVVGEEVRFSAHFAYSKVGGSR